LEADAASQTTLGVTDPGGWGYSLANLTEIMFPCLEAARSRSVVEVGAYRGELTRELLDWAAGAEAKVIAVDPDPPDELLQLAAQRPELELIRETSHEALGHIPAPDAVVIDGDHNYYTLSEELRLIESRSGPDMPLLIFHDVGWPHARRDTYCAAERIPTAQRQPLAHNVRLAPWEPGIAERGLPFECAAEREGGPRNGVLTALEDFVEAHDGLRLATVPAFFGFGLLWREDAPWAGAVSAIVEPWDRNPVLERLEANRVAHLAARHGLVQDLEEARDHGDAQARVIAERDEQLLERDQRVRERDQRLREYEQLLTAMLESRAFAVAERLSRLRQGGKPVFSRAQVRRTLGEGDGAR
jgi:hypothetical protein